MGFSQCNNSLISLLETQQKKQKMPPAQLQQKQKKRQEATIDWT